MISLPFTFFSPPAVTIQRAVLNSVGTMRRVDSLHACEVGSCLPAAREAGDAMDTRGLHGLRQGHGR
jgi:hypothetical protein